MQQQASLLAYIDVFWILMLLALAAVPLALILHNIKLGGAAAIGVVAGPALLTTLTPAFSRSEPAWVPVGPLEDLPFGVVRRSTVEVPDGDRVVRVWRALGEVGCSERAVGGDTDGPEHDYAQTGDVAVVVDREATWCVRRSAPVGLQPEELSVRRELGEELVAEIEAVGGEAAFFEADLTEALAGPDESPELARLASASGRFQRVRVDRRQVGRRDELAALRGPRSRQEQPRRGVLVDWHRLPAAAVGRAAGVFSAALCTRPRQGDGAAASRMADDRAVQECPRRRHAGASCRVGEREPRNRRHDHVEAVRRITAVRSRVGQWIDHVVQIERQVIAGLVNAGCRYIQIDAPGYTELNDPDVQARHFAHQVGEKEEQQIKAELVRALPELKEASVALPWQGITREQLAQRLAAEHGHDGGSAVEHHPDQREGQGDRAPHDDGA